jgi:hypothetical protein
MSAKPKIVFKEWDREGLTEKMKRKKYEDDDDAYERPEFAEMPKNLDDWEGRRIIIMSFIIESNLIVY